MIELAGSAAPPPRPGLPGTVVVREGPDDVLDAAGADLLIQAKNCVRAFGDFHLAVSVMPGTEPLLRRLMYDPLLRDLPWKRTHLWITDERIGGPADEESRFEALRQLVVEQSDIPAEQAHEIAVAGPDADRAYERDLREQLGWREKGHDRLDYVLLGLREDAGVAGLAGLAAAAGAGEEDRLARRFEHGPGRAEVSLTIGMINAARFIAVMAMGRARREAVGEVVRAVRGPGGPAVPPAGRLRPLAGELRWYLDHEALPG